MHERKLDDDEQWEATKGLRGRQAWQLYAKHDPLAKRIREIRKEKGLNYSGAERTRKREHGTPYCYNAGCKNPECKAAKAKYERERRREKKRLRIAEQQRRDSNGRPNNDGGSTGTSAREIQTQDPQSQD